MFSPNQWIIFSPPWWWSLNNKSLKILWTQIYLFSFVTCAFNVISKKALPKPRSWRFNPVFSSKSYIVLALAFRSMIHFESFFLLWCEQRSNFIHLHVDIQLSQKDLLYRLFCSFELSWHLYWKSVDHKWKCLFPYPQL